LANNNSISKDDLAEKGTLASIFDDPEVIDEVSEILAPEDFYEAANETLYALMLAFREQGKPIHPIGIASELNNNGGLKNIGGIMYITELTNPSSLAGYATDAVGYALIVKEHAEKRKLQVLGEEILGVATTGSGMSAGEALTFAEENLFKISNSALESSSIKNLGSLFDETVTEIEEAGKNPEGVAVGVPSGFIELDNKTSGFHPGELIIIAARPAIGKSTIAVDIARHASLLAGKTVLMFSLEMGAKELLKRIISAQTRIELQKLKTGNMTRDEWKEFMAMRSEIAQSNFFIDDTAKVSLGRVRSAAMKQKMRPEGLDMIVIDYLQLMEISSRRGNATRENEVSELSRGLKLLAKELQIPVIILSQLNRGSEQRADKTPAISDLRESGSLEQDADVILLLHRPEVYDENDRPGEADLIIGKQRNGPTGKIVLIPMLEISKFANGTGIIASGIEVSGVDDETPF
jgi:replicative DNA helicase